MQAYLGFQPTNIFYQASAPGDSSVFDMGDVYSEFTLTLQFANVTSVQAALLGSLDQQYWYQLTGTNLINSPGTYWGPTTVSGTLARYLKGSIVTLGGTSPQLTAVVAAR